MKKTYKIQFIITSIFYVLSIIVISISHFNKNYCVIQLNYILIMIFNVISLILSNNKKYYDLTMLKNKTKNIFLVFIAVIYITALLSRAFNNNVFVRLYNTPIGKWVEDIMLPLIFLVLNLLVYRAKMKSR